MQFKTVSPVGDRVFVKVEQAEEKTSSGILLPSSAQKKPTQGEIVGAGSAKAVKVGRKRSRGSHLSLPVGLGYCNVAQVLCSCFFLVLVLIL